jgi:hypothetical protein
MVPYDEPVISMDMMYRFMGLDHHLVSKWPSSIGFEVSKLFSKSESRSAVKRSFKFHLLE